MTSRTTRGPVVAGLAAAALLVTGCAGAGGAGAAPEGSDAPADGDAINVLMVGNPQMEDLNTLAEDNFTADTGIEVNITILPENELRDRVTQDVATQGGQYDVVTIGAYEANIWASNEWLTDLSPYIEEDPDLKADDFIDPVLESLQGTDGEQYAVPFYGESSFLMYRKDLFEANGLTMPERPTWDEVAGFAEALDESEPGLAGICLRGLAGWGEVFAPLTTVVNTYGGTWFTEDYEAQVNSPEFTAATQFYVDLVTTYGQDGASQAGFTECLNAFGQGDVAMWYDATSAAGSLEDPEVSTVAGNVGYAFAPVKETETSGWLWAWSFAVPETSEKKDAAYEFISWASSAEYEQLVGEELGWSRVPAGKRESTYEIAEYQEAAGAFADITLQAIKEAKPNDPGVQPRPTVGVQYVAIPEFSDLGTRVAQEVSAAIAGQQTVDEALEKGQTYAEEVAADYQE